MSAHERCAQVLERHAPQGRGLVVAVRSEGATRTWARGDLPAGERSLLEIGSVTKVLTATLLALLVDDGVVGLDDPVSDHLPVPVPVRGRPITLGDLATHHSGLPRLPAGLLLRGTTLDRADPYARLDDARMRRAIRETRPRKEPGTAFTYSNYGFGLLGHALAHTTRTPYAALLAERVTGPLGMADTGVDVPPADRGRLAQGRSRLGRPVGRWDLAGLVGAGGLVSSAADLMTFLALHAPGASGRLADAARASAVRRRDLHRGAGVGLGWIVLTGPAAGGRSLLMHDGGTGGYRCFVSVVPSTGEAVVVLSAGVGSVSGLGMRLARALVPDRRSTS